MEKYEDWAIRVSRLLELIAMGNDAIKMHTKGHSHSMIVEQYTELRDEHLAELSDLLKETGITIQLTQIQNAA